MRHIDREIRTVQTMAEAQNQATCESVTHGKDKIPEGAEIVQSIEIGGENKETDSDNNFTRCGCTAKRLNV